MAIKHSFVSEKADGADNTLVKPSDWNETHVIENGSILPSNISSGSASAGTVLTSLGSGSAAFLGGSVDILMMQIFS